MEQRNGRIDRKLQRADEVRCHYFFYKQRPEDRVLVALVNKTETIQKELGSLSPVLERRLERLLGGGSPGPGGAASKGDRGGRGRVRREGHGRGGAGGGPGGQGQSPGSARPAPRDAEGVRDASAWRSARSGTPSPAPSSFWVPIL